MTQHSWRYLDDHSSLISFRPTLENDLDFVLKAEQNVDNRQFVGQWTREQHAVSLLSEDVAHLIIEHPQYIMPVGYLILMELQNSDKSLQLRRIVITEKGKGVGREAIRFVKKIAFEKLAVHRLWLDVKDYNVRAQKLYKSEGFVIEGVLRECTKVGDVFESYVIMSILEAEYKSLTEKPLQK